jgi:predicted transcriptional regulator
VNKPTIHGNRLPLTASNVLSALGDDLTKIKSDDKIRWTDIGEVLGVSEDQAAKYADGSAAMNVVAYTRARAVWGKRATGRVDALVDGWRPEVDPYHTQSCVLKAALSIAEALEDGDLSIDEIRQNRTTLVNARDAIDAQLARLNPVAVQG